MKLEQVKSSNIKAVGYNEDESLLAIEFNTGAEYHYFNVPYRVFSSLMESDSKGKFFAANIKGKYEYKEIQGA